MALADKSLGDIAAGYINNLGLALIPLRAHSKEPATAHGLNDWTDDPEYVRDAFDAHPEWNMAAVLGKPSGGVVAIDIDVDDDLGYDGYEYLNKWEREHGELPETASVITGRGGAHLYYRVDREIKPSVNEEVHIDIRGDGSYAMLPPSVHPNGNVTQWENHPDDYPIADADDNVYAFIESVTAAPASRKRFKLPKEIKAGKRNDTLYKYGCSLRSKGTDDALISATLETTNRMLCKPPLSDDELGKIVNSVLELKPGVSADYAPTDKDKPKSGRQSFNHAKFGDTMIEKDHVCLIDGAIAIYRDGCYHMGKRAVESGMIKRRHDIRSHDRNEVLKYLEIEAPVRHLADKKYIAFKNCVLDITTNETFQMSPEWIIPNIIPHNWNPDAEDPVIGNIFARISCFDTSILQNLFEVIGYSMYRGSELATCPILFGTGQNGKSTFLNMLHRILGDENVSALDVATIGERFQTIPLIGKLANIGDDIANDFVSGSKASIVKKIITGDWVQAEYKGGDTFMFKPYCTMIFSCNEFPRIGDSSEGMMRRLHPVKFGAKFSPSDPDYDPYVEDKLSTESACETAIYFGVLALQECLRRKAFTKSETSVDEIENIRLTNSTVYQFAVDELGLGSENPVDIIGQSTNSIFTKYLSYCDELRIRTPVRQPRFSSEIKNLYGCEIGLRYVETAKGKKRARCFVPRIDQ